MAALHQLLRRADGQHAAFVHQGNAVAAGGLVHKVGGHENGDFVLPRQFQQVPPEHVAGGGIDARGRLVENQDFGVVQAGGGQLQALADAQGQRGGRGVGHVGQIELFECFGYRRRAPAAHIVKLGVQFQVLPHAQFFIQRKRLRHITHAHFGFDAARIDRLPQNLSRALGGFQKAGEHFHGGGLAAAVAAQKAENLALLNGETHMIHGGETAETLGQAVRLHRGRRIGHGHERRKLQTARALLFFGRQHFDIGFFEVVCPVFAQHLGGGPVFQQPPRVHRQEPLKLLRLFDIGGGDNHRHARVLLPQVVDQSPKLAARERIDARGRLVENQQIGAVHQCAAQAGLLLHPARELARRTVHKRQQPRGLGKLADARLPLFRVQAEHPRVKIDVFGHGERGIEVAPQTLRHKGDAVRHFPPHVFVGHIAAEHFHPPALNHAHARNQREQRRFAHAVRPDQADRDAARNVQRHIVQRKGFAETVGKAGNGNTVHGQSFGRPQREGRIILQTAARCKRQRAEAV